MEIIRLLDYIDFYFYYSEYFSLLSNLRQPLFLYNFSIIPSHIRYGKLAGFRIKHDCSSVIKTHVLRHNCNAKGFQFIFNCYYIFITYGTNV